MGSAARAVEAEIWAADDRAEVSGGAGAEEGGNEFDDGAATLELVEAEGLQNISLSSRGQHANALPSFESPGDTVRAVGKRRGQQSTRVNAPASDVSEKGLVLPGLDRMPYVRYQVFTPSKGQTDYAPSEVYHARPGAKVPLPMSRPG